VEVHGDEVTIDATQKVIIRAVRPSDVRALQRLYDELDDDDRQHRFFAAYRPDLSFFEAMTTVDERGGARLLAELQARASGRIVGEAGYTALPNGDGELSMVVAKPWRGWLGPYLLDALTSVAAARGVPNLEADVLTVNRPMLALLRARHPVVMEHQDWSVVRLMIGTRGHRATWPREHDRPRVLIEGASGRWHAEEEAGAAGLRVLTCPGPGTGRPACPALSGAPCPLVTEADVVVVSHPREDERWQHLLDAHAALHPGVPVFLEPAVPDSALAAASGCPIVSEAGVVSFLRGAVTPEGERVEAADAVDTR
jgi:hypothetical protein